MPGGPPAGDSTDAHQSLAFAKQLNTQSQPHVLANAPRQAARATVQHKCTCWRGVGHAVCGLHVVHRLRLHAGGRAHRRGLQEGGATASCLLLHGSQRVQRRQNMVRLSTARLEGHRIHVCQYVRGWIMQAGDRPVATPAVQDREQPNTGWSCTQQTGKNLGQTVCSQRYADLLQLLTVVQLQVVLRRSSLHLQLQLLLVLQVLRLGLLLPAGLRLRLLLPQLLPAAKNTLLRRQPHCTPAR